MNQKNRKRSHRIWPREAWFAIVIAVVLSALGWAIFKLATSTENGTPPDVGLSILLGIISSVIASIIVILLQKAFVHDEHDALTKKLKKIEEALQNQNELYKSGIRSIHPKIYFDKKGKFWMDILNNTENRLDLIGHSLRTWFYPEYRATFCGRIKALLQAGKEVRIVLSAEDFHLNHVFATVRGGYDRKNLTKEEKTALALCQLLQGVAKEKRKHLKVYVADPARVTYMYIRTDSQAIVSPYIFSSSNSANAFLLELEPASAYAKAFERDFEDMIDNLNCLNLDLEEARCFEVL